MEGGWKHLSILDDSGWFHAFLKPQFSIRVAVETNTSGEGEKGGEGKSSVGFFFHFHFLYKSVKTTMKKIYPHM